MSSGSAPVLLIGGWTVAGALQRPGYDPLTQTISSLAAYGAAYRWLMTGVMIAVGICYAVTAIGLRGVASPGRIMLGCGGMAAMLVALSPEPVSGTTVRHTAAAAVGVVALAVWPLLAAQRHPARPWVLDPRLSALVTAVLLLAALWFLITLRGHGPAGAAERVVTAAEALWPPIVVAACLRIRGPRSPASAEP